MVKIENEIEKSPLHSNFLQGRKQPRQNQHFSATHGQNREDNQRDAQFTTRQKIDKVVKIETQQVSVFLK